MAVLITSYQALCRSNIRHKYMFKTLSDQRLTFLKLLLFLVFTFHYVIIMSLQIHTLIIMVYPFIVLKFINLFLIIASPWIINTHCETLYFMPKLSSIYFQALYIP